ncbi:MAG TPA: hypothetical protein VKZ54_11950 [Membranihabitans sp.]|nr:hypothetical protein [Membranihabitans sp.]
MNYFSKKAIVASPSGLTIFDRGWKITLMFISVLFLFTACEVDDTALKGSVESEKLTDYSSMSEQEWVNYIQNLDRSQMNEKQSDLIIKKIEGPTKLRVRASCTLEVYIERTVGTATQYLFSITEVGNSLPVFQFPMVSTWTDITSIDDTKEYDILVQPMNGGSNEEYWVHLRANNFEYSISMLTWNPARQVYWWGFDKFDCN